MPAQRTLRQVRENSLSFAAAQALLDKGGQRVGRGMLRVR